MPRVMTLGRVAPAWRMSMRQTVDPLLYFAGQPTHVGGLGMLGTPGEPSWTMPGGWGPRPPAYPGDNHLRPTSGGCGPTDPRCRGGTGSGLGSVLKGASRLGIGALAQLPGEPPPATDAATADVVRMATGYWLVWSALGVVGGAMGAYHGYKRNNSLGWGIAWALLGSMFPIITIPISLAQGFGKRKGR